MKKRCSFYVLVFLAIITSCSSKDEELFVKEPVPETEIPVQSTESAFFNTDTLAAWEGGSDYYKQWANGPSSDTTFFPIAVWLQDPTKASEIQQIKAMGVNTYIGLWNGPTTAQLKGIADNGMYTICYQNETALNATNKQFIKSWMHVDEPDHVSIHTNDVVMPDEIIRRYNDMKAADNTRPVYINLAQGVASDNAYGRGRRTNHPEDYPEYVKGADILSFDVYPSNIRASLPSDEPFRRAYHDDVGQKPWVVATGVDRLRAWSNYAKPVWVWIECTNFNSVWPFMLTPKIMKAEVWLALTHGARGIGYFMHILLPAPVKQAGLLNDAVMTAAVTNVNKEILELAPVLNKPTVANGATVKSSNPEINIHYMVKRQGRATYLFAVSDRPGVTTGRIKLKGFKGAKFVEVYGENRTLTAMNGEFSDFFNGYDVHIYKIAH